MTRRKIELVDSSILINVIGIRMEAGHAAQIAKDLQVRLTAGTTLYIPVAAVVETAQHVQRIPDGEGRHRRECADSFTRLMKDCLDGVAPRSFRGVDWDGPLLRDFLDQSGPPLDLVNSLGNRTAEAGDLLILSELRRLRRNYPRNIVDLGVWTLDGGLEASASEIV